MEGEGMDLGAMMSRIMENPEFASLVASLRTGTANASTDSGVPDAAEVISEETSDSNSIQKIRRAASTDESTNKGNDINVSDDLSDEFNSERLREMVSAIAPLIKNSGKRISGREDVERRNRLLSALKPYLNQNKQEMIDRIMAISRITGLLDIMPGSHV